MQQIELNFNDILKRNEDAESHQTLTLPTATFHVTTNTASPLHEVRCRPPALKISLRKK